MLIMSILGMVGSYEPSPLVNYIQDSIDDLVPGGLSDEPVMRFDERVVEERAAEQVSSLFPFPTDCTDSNAFLTQVDADDILRYYAIDLADGSADLRTFPNWVAADGYINGIGFCKSDGFIYGNGTLRQNAKIIRMGLVSNLTGTTDAGLVYKPRDPIGWRAYAGDVINVTGTNSGSGSIPDCLLYQITGGTHRITDISNFDAAATTLASPQVNVTYQGVPSVPKILDLAFHPGSDTQTEAVFYAVSSDEAASIPPQLIQGTFNFDSSGNPQTIMKSFGGITGVDSQDRTFGAAFFSVDGGSTTTFYFSSNETGSIYELDISQIASPSTYAVFSSNGPISATNDGARNPFCPLPSNVFDFGDAPESYGRPSHSRIVKNVRIGTIFTDIEAGPYTTSNSTTDDPSDQANDYADERTFDLTVNGLTFSNTPLFLTEPFTNLLAFRLEGDGAAGPIGVPDPVKVYLSMWIDVDQDGNFNVGNDQYLLNEEYIVDRASNGLDIPFTEVLTEVVIPDVPEGLTWLRLRISTSKLGTAQPWTGAVQGGEVEDHLIRIVTSTTTTTTTTTTNFCSRKDKLLGKCNEDAFMDKGQNALLSKVLDPKSKSASKQCAQPVGPEVCYAADFNDMSSALFGLVKFTLKNPEASDMTVDTYLEPTPSLPSQFQDCGTYLIEIHSYWPYDYQSVQVGDACSREFLGGVYDPTLACMYEISANWDACNLLGREATDSSSNTYSGCMYGEFVCQSDTGAYYPETEEKQTFAAPFSQGFCSSSSRDPWASIAVRCSSNEKIIACAPLRPCAGGKKHALGIKDLLLHDTLTGLLGSKDIETISQLVGKTDDLISETVMLLTGGAGGIADTLTNLLTGKELLVSGIISEFVLPKEAFIGEQFINKESHKGLLGGILNKDGMINESLQGLLAKIGLDH